jgi:hypothetical protein
MSNAWQLCACVRGRVSGREGMGLETLLESTIARSRPRRSCCDDSVGSKTNTNNNSTTTVNPTGVSRRVNADEGRRSFDRIAASKVDRTSFRVGISAYDVASPPPSALAPEPHARARAHPFPRCLSTPPIPCEQPSAALRATPGCA